MSGSKPHQRSTTQDHERSRLVLIILRKLVFRVLLSPAAVGEQEQHGRHHALGAAYRVAGRYAEAEESHREALTMYEAFDYRGGVAETLNLQAILLLVTGATQKALERYNEALSIARTADARLEQARALEGLGHCTAALSQHDTAHTYFNQALAIFEVASAAQAVADLRNRISTGNPNLTM